MKLRPIGKKADLSLSINAIVILILAITMLGLGLGFMRGTFSKTTAQFAEVSETVKEQIVDDIKATNDKVAFNKLEITMKRGDKRDLFYGIRNVLDDSETFGITAVCDRALSGGTPSDIKLETFPDWEVAQGEVEVLKLVVSADTEAKIDTYACRLDVTEGTGNDASNYDSKKFFVVVQ